MAPVTGHSNIAVVVPVLDDTAALERLLATIAAWPARPAEIAVVDASAGAAVTALCARHGCTLVRAQANRGLQLDVGARATTAPIVWFLHADADPPAEGPAAIEHAIAAGAVGGCFRFRFAGARTPTKRVLEQLVALRVRCGGIAYGDQGLFARRAAYVAAGGFPHQPLFEEVRLVRALRRNGRFRVLQCTLPVATRRWEHDGWWRRSCRNRWLALLYACGTPAQRLATTYHIRHPRSSETST